ncbi:MULTISPECIES: hypothetical protein [Glutamicibacter]|uniref:hypothetical protein n=1 Tax=Glutamicibacter TaxID=1742989 RepID=UPI000AEE15E3|nr:MULTISPECIES: hypothetical protein [Glutamicibacter]WIV45751.1 hypothetical protein QQS42_06045 [Glutamicibacter nicotianae]
MNHVQQMMLKLAMQIIAAGELLIHMLFPKLRDSRGDVPGWVMITLMSALLVAALLAIAGPRLQDLFNQAIDRVSGLG